MSARAARRRDVSVAVFFILSGAALLGLRPANAAVIGTCADGVLAGTTCTLTGPNVIWQYDIDDSNNPGIGLYGDPSLLGDVVQFIPPSFVAASADGGTATAGIGQDFIFDSVSLIGGAQLQGIEVVEFGDYEITSGDGDNSDRVSADLGVTVASNVVGGDFGIALGSFDAAGDSGGQQTWQISATWTPFLLGNSTGLDGLFNALDVSLRIQNRLEAVTTGIGDAAQIQKKISVAAVVPVPAAAWLFGSALGLLGWIRRRAAM